MFAYQHHRSPKLSTKLLPPYHCGSPHGLTGSSLAQRPQPARVLRPRHPGRERVENDIRVTAYLHSTNGLLYHSPTFTCPLPARPTLPVLRTASQRPAHRLFSEARGAVLPLAVVVDRLPSHDPATKGPAGTSIGDVWATGAARGAAWRTAWWRRRRRTRGCAAASRAARYRPAAPSEGAAASGGRKVGGSWQMQSKRREHPMPATANLAARPRRLFHRVQCGTRRGDLGRRDVAVVVRAPVERVKVAVAAVRLARSLHELRSASDRVR